VVATLTIQIVVEQQYFFLKIVPNVSEKIMKTPKWQPETAYREGQKAQ
jgi:hypothetical protein